MSLTRTAYITINTKINIESVTKILQNALTRGFYFFDDGHSSGLQRLSFEAALNTFLFPTPEVIEDGGPCIDAIFNDGRFNFRIVEYDNETHIMLSPLLELWIKEVGDDVCMDFARYANILLEISHPFEVLSIKLEVF